METIVKTFTDQEVKEQVELVISLGRRTIEDSFRLGEMLVSKKAEKDHGEWLPYLEELGISHDIAKSVMKAFKNKDNYTQELSFTQFVKLPKSGLSTISKDKQPDWFDQNTNSDIEAFTLRAFTGLQKKIEKEFGIVYLNEFSDAINTILSLGITHLNYKELWKQE